MSFGLYESGLMHVRSKKSQSYVFLTGWCYSMELTIKIFWISPGKSLFGPTGTPYIDFYLKVGSFVFVVLMLYVFSVYDYNARDVYALYLRVFFGILFRISYSRIFIKIEIILDSEINLYEYMNKKFLVLFFFPHIY